MILPYRAKNPPEHFPYVTITLIVINVLVWALTSDNFVVIRRDALMQYAVSHNNLSLWRLTSAMFLHGSLMHIAGNMLFLWIFGASVEGRLRPPKFILMYFLAGYTGGLLSDFVQGATNPDIPSLGASGAIMGVAGAYMYMFPYSLICVAYGLRYRWGVSDWQARWVVLLYVGMDITFALLFHGADGVGHFAHLGGVGAGLLFCALLRSPRDSEEKSNAQATRADVKDYSLLSLHELEALLQTPTEDTKLVLAYCEKANTYTDNARPDQILAYMNYYGPKLMMNEDPNRIAHVLLRIPPQVGGMPSVYYLRLASRLESIASNELAISIYRRIYDLAPQSPDTEMALYRMGQIMQNNFRNYSQAHAAYSELLRQFPNGQMAFSVRQALQQMQRDVAVNPGLLQTQAVPVSTVTQGYASPQATQVMPSYAPQQTQAMPPQPYASSSTLVNPVYPQPPAYAPQPTQVMPPQPYTPSQPVPSAPSQTVPPGILPMPSAYTPTQAMPPLPAMAPSPAVPSIPPHTPPLGSPSSVPPYDPTHP